MATTRGQADPEVTRTERAASIATNAIAGQGIVRRVVLYVILFAATIASVWLPPLAALGIIAGVLLLATDTGLA